MHVLSDTSTVFVDVDGDDPSAVSAHLLYYNILAMWTSKDKDSVKKWTRANLANYLAFSIGLAF